MSTEDWNELYGLAMDRHPEIYRALVRSDIAVRDLVVNGATRRDERVAAQMQDHDHLMGALRILRRAHE
jgi:hypothetical protein